MFKDHSLHTDHDQPPDTQTVQAYSTSAAVTIQLYTKEKCAVGEWV